MHPAAFPQLEAKISYPAKRTWRPRTVLHDAFGTAHDTPNC